jgi:16S rRNA (cytidine1402-2'-O)-methyltransferase
MPLTGPSSILLALMASGFNGQRFSFHGYLPRDKKERSARIRELETRALRQDQTQIFIETPYRNVQLMEALLDTCHQDTKICVAMDLTLPGESVITRTISQWGKIDFRNMHKRPAVFLLYY